MDAIVDILRKVFPEEEANLINRLRKRKFLLSTFILAILIAWAYANWPQFFNSLLTMLLTTSNTWLPGVLFLWLLTITIYLYRKEKIVYEREFKDDFQHGLQKWEYYGDWRSERDDGGNILSITNSDIGGIAKSCRLWDDYIFTFETKIIQSNSSWIIRASDILNYVMLQCSPTEIIPHFRVQGQWFKMQPVALTTPLPMNEWLKIRIMVKGTRVVATAKLNAKEKVLIDQLLLEPQVVPVQVAIPNTVPSQFNFIFSFPLGSVGFRESGNAEHADFRNVHVTKITT